MNVTPEEVLRVARLAALAVDEGALPVLTDQVRQILEFVAQLDQIDSGTDEPDVASRPRLPLREDVPQRFSFPLELSRIAPAFKDGLFLVPQVEGVGESHREPEER